MAFNKDKCLKFTTSKDNCVISLPVSKNDSSHYYFSKDGTTWVPDTITLNANECCYVRGTAYPSKSISASGYISFSISEKVTVSGNVMSLVDNGAGELTEITQEYGFACLFSGCSQVQNIDKDLFPAMTLKRGCYSRAFQNCTGLISLPSFLLPAAVGQQFCYQEMFIGCTEIKEIPSKLMYLTTVANSSCYRMFKDCSSLIKIASDILPATTLDGFSYASLFQNCIKLEEIPDDLICATTYAANSLREMFSGCSRLNKITVHFTSWVVTNGTYNWVKDVSAHGTFYCPDELPDTRGVSNIPTGWEKKPIPSKKKSAEHRTIQFRGKYFGALNKWKEAE